MARSLSIPHVQLREASTGQVVVRHLLLADHFWSRWRGLQFRQPLPHGTGLLLVPCRGIHTCFVRDAIDVIMLDGAGRVLRLCRRVAPWRIRRAPRGTHAVLELAHGTLELPPEARLLLTWAESAPLAQRDIASTLPASLRFLLPESPFPC
jgi:uncharacterized membrane protein (UPF0127 family)